MRHIKDFLKKSYILIIIVIICLLLPQFIDSQYIFLIFSLMGIYIIATSGLDVLYGYAGQISLGQAGFYCIGAYGSAILSKTVGINPWLTILIASAGAAVIGFFFAFPTARLRFMFLSMVTTAFGELVYQVVVNIIPDATGSNMGFRGVPKFSVFGSKVTTRTGFYYIVLVMVVFFLFVKQRIIKSRAGRAFIAIRDNATAAGAMGINVVKYKGIALATSAFYAAFAGGLYAHMVGFISPESFTRALSLMFLTINLFGGRGSFIGPIIGSIILSLVNEAVQPLGQYQQLVYGAFIVIIVLFMPGGIAGTVDRIKSFKEKKRNVT